MKVAVKHGEKGWLVKFVHYDCAGSVGFSMSAARHAADLSSDFYHRNTHMYRHTILLWI